MPGLVGGIKERLRIYRRLKDQQRQVTMLMMLEESYNLHQDGNPDASRELGAMARERAPEFYMAFQVGVQNGLTPVPGSSSWEQYLQYQKDLSGDLLVDLLRMPWRPRLVDAE